MSDKPIPVGELIQRLIQRRPGASPKINTVRRRAPFPKVIPRYGVVVTGRLQGHGAGSPPHRMGQPSYYVKILTTAGPKILWGADLKRAIAESETRPGPQSLVGVQPVGYQVLKLPPSAGGKTVRRTRWRVESIEFFARRVRQAREAREARFRGRASVRSLPPKEPMHTRMKLAQAFADRHIYNPHDRKRFLEELKQKLTVESQIPNRRRRDYEPPSR